VQGDQEAQYCSFPLKHHQHFKIKTKRNVSLILATRQHLQTTSADFCWEPLPQARVRLRLIVNFPNGIPVSLTHTHTHTHTWETQRNLGN
jgi:hypothetical protein